MAPSNQSAQVEYSKRIANYVNARFAQFKQDMLSFFEGWLDKKVSPLEERLEVLENEVVRLSAENKLLQQKLLQSEGDGAAAISLCKQQIKKIDLLASFLCGGRRKLEKRFLREGKEIKETYNLLQLLEQIAPHHRSAVDGEDISDLVGPSGFSEELRGLLER